LVSRVAERFSFGKIPEVLPLPDLLAVQHESFKWFLDEGFREIFEEISPIEDFTGSLALELTDHRFGEPQMTLEEAKERDQNYAMPLFVTARFMNRQTGEIKEQQVFLGDFPIMTEKGVFIINGTERVIVSQLVRSPGIYFDVAPDKTSDKEIFSGKIIPGRGAWLEFDTDKKDTIGVRVDRKRRQYITAFLKALGPVIGRRLFAVFLTDLVTADPGEVVALRVAEQGLDQTAGRLDRGGLTRSQLAVEVEQRLFLAVGGVLLDRVLDRLGAIEHGEDLLVGLGDP
jgi:DNA-directed RNA polymerase beta subunit